jgi:hypothetical protein
MSIAALAQNSLGAILDLSSPACSLPSIDLPVFVTVFDRGGLVYLQFTNVISLATTLAALQVIIVWPNPIRVYPRESAANSLPLFTPERSH